jgi:hypothetical protein
MITRLFVTVGFNLCLLSTTFGKAINNFAFAKTDSIPANIEDVRSIDAIIHAVYDVISGDSAVKRNWDRMRTLFIPEARMMSTGIRPDGTARYRAMTVEDYISLSGPILEKNGFFETELVRKTEQFGNIAHAFSTYQSKHKQADEKPFARGINSIQLMFDGKRWWIVSIYWTGESPTNPLPEKYLKD